MLRRNKVIKETEQVSDIICNICSNSCRYEYGLDNSQFEFAKISAMWGYGSLKDNEQHEAHICEPCYDQYIIPLFKLNPVVFRG